MNVALRGMPGLHPPDADRRALECVLWRDQQDQCRDALVAEGALLGQVRDGGHRGQPGGRGCSADGKRAGQERSPNAAPRRLAFAASRSGLALATSSMNRVSE
jgi:hypothetical protein